jgi:hypothetical protein
VEEKKYLRALIPCGLDEYDASDRKRTAKNDGMRILVGMTMKERTRRGRHGLLVKKEKMAIIDPRGSRIEMGFRD